MYSFLLLVFSSWKSPYYLFIHFFSRLFHTYYITYFLFSFLLLLVIERVLLFIYTYFPSPTLSFANYALLLLLHSTLPHVIFIHIIFYRLRQLFLMLLQ